MRSHTELSQRSKQEQPLQDMAIFKDTEDSSLSEVNYNSDMVPGHTRKSRILLAISVQPTDTMLQAIAAGKQPHRDYHALQQALDAYVIYPNDTPTTLLGRLIRRLFGARIVVAWGAYRRRKAYDYIFSDTEKVGLPLAMLMKLSRTPPGHPRHTLIAQYLSPFEKRIFFRLGAGSHLDTISVHSSAQRALAIDKLHMPKERMILLPMFADTEFWRPPEPSNSNSDIVATTTQRPIIFSAGLERRDYPTLFAAVRDLDLDVHIAAASAAAIQRDAADRRTRGTGTRLSDLPSNVFIKSCNYVEMRQLYAAARFVVVSVVETDDSAGLTVILEAMAMGKAVIVSGTRGQTDVIRDPRNNGRGLVKREWWPGFLDNPEVADTLGRLPTGFYVTPGDPDELREMIQYLLNHPEVAEELGRNGRRVIEEYFTLEAFAQRHAAAILGKAYTIPKHNT
jgi:glycosyltransferase involved in cell wall biosynthesis